MAAIDKTIQLNASTVQLFNDTFSVLKGLDDSLKDIQSQFAAKQEQLKSTNSKMEGILVGVLTNEGIDITEYDIRLKEDFTEIYATPKLKIASMQSLNGEVTMEHTTDLD